MQQVQFLVTQVQLAEYSVKLVLLRSPSVFTIMLMVSLLLQQYLLSHLSSLHHLGLENLGKISLMWCRRVVQKTRNKETDLKVRQAKINY